MTTTISPAAAKRIMDALNYKLWEAGFQGNKEVKALAVSVATAVRRIVLEDAQSVKDPNPRT